MAASSPCSRWKPPLKALNSKHLEVYFPCSQGLASLLLVAGVQTPHPCCQACAPQALLHLSSSEASLRGARWTILGDPRIPMVQGGFL